MKPTLQFLTIYSLLLSPKGHKAAYNRKKEIQFKQINKPSQGGLDYNEPHSPTVPAFCSPGPFGFMPGNRKKKKWTAEQVGGSVPLTPSSMPLPKSIAWSNSELDCVISVCRFSCSQLRATTDGAYKTTILSHWSHWGTSKLTGNRPALHEYVQWVFFTSGHSKFHKQTVHYPKLSFCADMKEKEAWLRFQSKPQFAPRPSRLENASEKQLLPTANYSLPLYPDQQTLVYHRSRPS